MMNMNVPPMTYNNAGYAAGFHEKAASVAVNAKKASTLEEKLDLIALSLHLTNKGHQAVLASDLILNEKMTPQELEYNSGKNAGYNKAAGIAKDWVA